MLRLLFVFLSCSSQAEIAAILRPLIIAHRGASGYLPEHTRPAYELAIHQGADFIEPDLVSSKDGALIVRHENNIADTTDVAQKFPQRKTTKIIDGEKITGFFTEDFTLQELKTLRAKERLPHRSHLHDGQFELLTFSEVLEIAKAHGVGVYPETKHPTYFRSIGLPLEENLLKELRVWGLDQIGAAVIVQSFELGNLFNIHQSALFLKLVYLLEEPERQPFDHVTVGDPRLYGDMVTVETLRSVSSLLYGIGPHKRMIVSEVKSHLAGPTQLISNAHKRGLVVHPYAFRSDKEFLHQDYGDNFSREYEQFVKLGVDGFFTDFSRDAVHALMQN